MDYEEFKRSVEEAFPNHGFSAKAFEEICQEEFAETEKAVEYNGDENLDLEGWWEIAMETLPDRFVTMTREDYGF